MILDRHQYSFNASAGTVTLKNEIYHEELVLSIFNVTRKTFIYTNDPDIIGKSAAFSYSGNDTILTLDFDTSGHSNNDVLRISVCADEEITDVDVFGAAITTEPSNQISERWDKTLTTNDCTYTANGTSTTTQPADEGSIHLFSGTGTATTRIQHNRTVLYNQMQGNFGGFTWAVKVPPTDSADFAYRGLTTVDRTDQFIIVVKSDGLHVQHIRGGVVLTDVARADFNGKDISWLDTTKLNIFRIKYGWLSSACVDFEVSPNGGRRWFKMHTLRYPNTSQRANVKTPNLTLIMGITKTSGTATNIECITGSACAGSYSSVAGLRDSDRNGRVRVEESIIISGLLTPLTTSIHTNVTGRTLFVTSMHYACSNLLSTGGNLQFLDGATVKHRDIIGGSTNQFSSTIRQDIFYGNNPMRCDTGLSVSIPATGIGSQTVVTIKCYEEVIL